MDKKKLSERDICSKYITPALSIKSYEIYLPLYQAVTGNEEEKNIYKQFTSEFFDQPPLTRRERANNVKKRNYFTRNSGVTCSGFGLNVVGFRPGSFDASKFQKLAASNLQIPTWLGLYPKL